ncbi:hypothetical protein GAP32_004 [Cronobacter phage vB_CsaM_GAP32]|uniref:Uncharacterized protein n=1 Tax=Cronobacter phage vB_CsaM_GAP32 TaxID=1141136 RepID=K4F5I7_9CAUD|nr:hypothetical protein GAP32_004 [Cronobacter phage vB_CsaM_GAP32]AFC21451.1 hypothetical protein GAP32_004 [Cronobacter phage vB_CsaM_GAP32]
MAGRFSTATVISEKSYHSVIKVNITVNVLSAARRCFLYCKRYERKKIQKVIKKYLTA